MTHTSVSHKNAAESGHPSQYVPSSMSSWRFRYSERLAKCLWRDKGSCLTSVGQRMKSMSLIQMRNYYFFVKDAPFPTTIFYVLQHIRSLATLSKFFRCKFISLFCHMAAGILVFYGRSSLLPSHFL